jgi:peptide-methionine (R)-S-oxide reductase
MNDEGKRNFLKVALGAIAGFATTVGWAVPTAARRAFAVVKSDAEWRRILSPLAYRVLRKEYTEPPFSSPLNNEKRSGNFICAGCGQKLFNALTKYDSGTGWPSFWRPIRGAVGTKADYGLHLPRTEVHCSRCGGHLGHVFDDGPEPTGKRYCMNGAALKFDPV